MSILRRRQDAAAYQTPEIGASRRCGNSVCNDFGSMESGRGDLRLWRVGGSVGFFDCPTMSNSLQTKKTIYEARGRIITNLAPALSTQMQRSSTLLPFDRPL